MQSLTCGPTTKSDLIRRRLLACCPEIDLVLGGHDHIYHYMVTNNSIFIKSGTDFREMTLNRLTLNKAEEASSEQKDDLYVSTLVKENKSFTMETQRIQLFSSYPKDAEIEAKIEEFEKEMYETYKKQICVLKEPVEAHFEYIRTRTMPLSNFVADLLLVYFNVDAVLFNSGSFRMDSLIESGPMTLGTLRRVFPMDFYNVRIKVKGETLLEALENSVSKYPALEGRFPTISNIEFEYDPSAKAMERINMFSFKKRHSLNWWQTLRRGKRIFNCYKRFHVFRL